MRLHLRYAGTDTPLLVAWDDLAAMCTAFEQAHRRQFGFLFPERAVILEQLDVSCSISSPRANFAAKFANSATPPLAHVPIYTAGKLQDAAVHHRDDLALGQTVEGPALVLEAHQTVVGRTRLAGLVADLWDDEAPSRQRPGSGRRWYQS